VPELLQMKLHDPLKFGLNILVSATKLN